jgi:trehalose 6-phosphate phosphatase
MGSLDSIQAGGYCGGTMKHFFKAWPAFEADCRAATHILLLADYDGTISPIVGRPEDAVLPSKVRSILSSLAQKPFFSVGVISGRRLAETKSLVAIDGLYYAGNHGVEIEGPGLSYVNPAAGAARSIIQDLAKKLKAELASVPGVIIQEKKYSLSVHYRLASKDKEKMITETVHRLVDPLVNRGEIVLYPMKKLWEVRPPVDWNKGKAVEFIARKIKAELKTEQLLTIYLGDDTTDEDAFRVVRRPAGWSIYIGNENRSSAAEYYLDSPEKVEEFLSRLNKMEL